MRPAPARPAPFGRAQLGSAQRELLRDGRFANARVERVRVDGVDWIFKDFAARAWWVRHGFGRFLLGREVRALQRLEGLPGIPSQAFRVDGCAMAARFVPGRTLGRVEMDDGRMSAEFLAALEALLQRVHARGLVHLDTRGGNNLLMMPDGAPGIIDFQAAVSTRWMPAFLRQWFEGLDLGGIYKKWLRFQPDAMGEARRARYEQINRWRRLWVFRGYLGVRRKAPPPGPTA